MELRILAVLFLMVSAAGCLGDETEPAALEIESEPAVKQTINWTVMHWRAYGAENGRPETITVEIPDNTVALSLDIYHDLRLGGQWFVMGLGECDFESGSMTVSAGERTDRHVLNCKPPASGHLSFQIGTDGVVQGFAQLRATVAW